MLFPAALIAGAINSVAGGGSFISFPALLFTGIPPIPANATNSVAVWPGSLASVWAYRRELHAERRVLIPMGLVSLLGGYIGARLLLVTPERAFTTLIPWLLLVATLLFTFGGFITTPLRKRMARNGAPGLPEEIGISLIQFIIAVYGGYFGAGIGILMLAALTMMGMDDIHRMNALKSLLATLINGVAIITFMVSRVVCWPQAALMVMGSVLGGYGGAWLARRTNPAMVRYIVILVGFSMTIYFFVK